MTSKKVLAQRDYAPTIFDVARLAGVSHQTVSRVINDLPNVRASTREKVEKAIEELGYRPSALARALVTRRSRTLGLLSVGEPDQGSGYVTMHFSESARAAHYQLSVESRTTVDDQFFGESIERFLSQNVEAIVIVSGVAAVSTLAADLQIRTPLLIVDAAAPPGLPSVAIDQYGGGVLATRHLIDLGHTEICHIAGPEWAPHATERRRGFVDTMTAAGLDATRVVAGDWNASSGFRAASQLLDTGPFTALFCANDHLALGAMAALDARGIGVPWNVSVIGFDDLPDAEFYRPALTTVRQDFAALGRRALQEVLSLIQSGEADDSPIAVEIVQRTSTRPPSTHRWP